MDQELPTGHAPVARNLNQELVDVAAPSEQHVSFVVQVAQAIQSAEQVSAPTSVRSGTITEGHFAWEPYEKKPQDLIRKECSLQEIKLHTRTNKADRIKCLRRYDELVNNGKRASEASTLATGSTRRTKHCVFRLINVLMSQDLVTRLIEVIGKNFDRQDLDDVQASQKVQFWKDVETKFRSNDEDCKGLIHDDVAFEALGEVRSFFSIYEANFRMSGTHSRHFKKFMRGQADVLYLWHWLKLRLDALSNVRGGLYVEDEFDSLVSSSATPTREVRSSTNTTPTGSGISKKRAGPGTPNNNPTKKAKPEADSMDVLLTLVGRITAAREAEAMQAMEPGHEAVARTRKEHYKMLDDIRKRISDIECEMNSAASPIKLRLQGDLEFFLEERERIMAGVRSQKL